MTTPQEAIKLEICDCCHKNEAESLHSCPYAQEMFQDDETLCNCCDECWARCSMDI